MPPTILLCALPVNMERNVQNVSEIRKQRRLLLETPADDNGVFVKQLRSWKEKDAKAWMGRICLIENSLDAFDQQELWHNRASFSQAEKMRLTRCVDDVRAVKRIRMLMKKLEEDEPGLLFANEFGKTLEKMAKPPATKPTRRMQTRSRKVTTITAQPPARMGANGPRKRLIAVKAKAVRKRALVNPYHHREWKTGGN